MTGAGECPAAAALTEKGARVSERKWMRVREEVSCWRKKSGGGSGFGGNSMKKRKETREEGEGERDEERSEGGWGEGSLKF